MGTSWRAPLACSMGGSGSSDSGSRSETGTPLSAKKEVLLATRSLSHCSAKGKRCSAPTPGRAAARAAAARCCRRASAGTTEVG